jgi:pimeloyl-ACP methyl ester carboxylesterase
MTAPHAPHAPLSQRRRWRRARRRATAAAQLAAVRTQLRVLEKVAPAAADRRALDLWCTLPPGARRRDLRPAGGEVHRVPVPRGGTAAAEVWGEGPTVYLMHGWGGWRGQLGAFVQPLVEAGHRVIALDAPGHGDSDPGFLGAGRGTVMEFIEALEATVERFGPPAGVVAHSMGCTVVGQVLAAGTRTDRLVLVAPNHEFSEIVAQFAGHLRLGDRTRDHLRAALEEITGRPLEAFDLEPLGTPGRLPGGVPPTLVVHDRDDAETPYRVATGLVAAFADARLVTTEGLGHHRVLAAPVTVEAAVGHLTGRAVPAVSRRGG